MGQFIDFCAYKAERAGKIMEKINARGTSIECSACGVDVKKSLADRLHVCVCGLIIDRDLNAAINILRRSRWWRQSRGVVAPGTDNVTGYGERQAGKIRLRNSN